MGRLINNRIKRKPMTPLSYCCGMPIEHGLCTGCRENAIDEDWWESDPDYQVVQSQAINYPYLGKELTPSQKAELLKLK